MPGKCEGRMLLLLCGFETPFCLLSYCYPSMLHAWFCFRHSYVSMPGSTGSLIYLWWYRHICNLKTLLVYHRKSSRCGLRRKRDDGRHATLPSFRMLSSSRITKSAFLLSPSPSPCCFHKLLGHGHRCQQLPLPQSRSHDGF